MSKTIDWSAPDPKHTEAIMSYMLKQGHIKKPKPLENVAYLYCKICGDTVHSKWSGDYVSCKCGRAAIDQTHEYTRLIGNEGVIKKVAEEYKSSVDSRVYASLMLYEVSSND